MATERAGVGKNAVLSQCVRDGIVLGAVAGAASGTAAAPVLGTIVGLVVGVVLAIPFSLIAGAAIAASVRESGTVRAYRRRVDVTLTVLAAGTALLAIGWISLDPLVGPSPAIAMLVAVVIGLAIVRRRLLRLSPIANG